MPSVPGTLHLAYIVALRFVPSLQRIYPHHRVALPHTLPESIRRGRIPSPRPRAVFFEGTNEHNAIDTRP
jgi:hypothetical protein